MARKNQKIAATLFGIQLCFSILLMHREVKAQDIDNPMSIEIGSTRVVTLNRNERNFFKISLPAGTFKVVLDIRRNGERDSNLQGTMSILDQDGASLVENAIRFNEIDVDYRRVHSFTLKTPSTLELKLSSDQDGTKFWLTVFKDSDPAPSPLFGNVVPTPILAGQLISGRLDTGESTYYLITLKKGDYKAVLDFTNSEGKNTNIQGYLALLDADGGNQEILINMNQIDVSYRKISSFSLKNDATLIMRVKNNIYRVNYSVKIIPASS